MTRRIVVTGIGAITPIGNDVPAAWDACRRGTNGIGPITQFDASSLPVRIVAEIKDFDPVAHFGAKETRRTSRVMQVARVAANEAVRDSKLDIASMGESVGVVIASGVGGLEFLEKAALTAFNDGWKRVSPFTVPSMIADMPAGVVSIDHGAKGPNFAVVSACASSAHAIGEAAEIIRRGDADVMITGGAEAGITMIGVASFAAMRALSTRNDDPATASRPFDRDRDGFVIAEGAAILILEDFDHARNRGATMHAELIGYGATADASHITEPDAEGRGAQRCVEIALKKAQLQPTDIDYINAHGTSTELNDAAETRAFKRIFGDAAYHVPISSTKSMTGHMLGAAGAFESLVCILAMRDHFVPPTINLRNPDPQCDLDYVPLTGRAVDVRHALTTSFGFGGHNAALIYSAVE